VILLDIGLPKLDGCEVCRRIRQQGQKGYYIRSRSSRLPCDPY
jgi:CheY-like chemotaxis protein